MLKIAEFIFILLIGIILIITAFLFSGIEIDTISYKNININKLYLKYDKNLNISTPSIIIKNNNSHQITKIKTSFTIDYNDGLFELNIKEFNVADTDIQFQGLVYIDSTKIDLDKKSSIFMKEVNLQFDKKMEQVISKKIFLDYENNVINASFQNPYYGKIDMSDSKVSFLVDRNILKLYLKTNSLLNKTIKNALLRYDLVLNTIQYDGKNDIALNIFIPFEEDDIFIESNITILDSNLENFGQKYKVNKSVLHYKDKILQGTTHLNNYAYKDFNATNSILNYTMNFKEKFALNINADKINLIRNQEKYNLNNTIFELKDNQLTFTSNIKDNTDKIDINLDNKTNLLTKEIEGNVSLKYNDDNNNSLINTDILRYSGNYKENLELNVSSQNIHFSKSQKNVIKNLSVNFKDSIVKTKFLLEDELQTFKVKVINQTDLNKQTSLGSIDIDKILFKNLIKVQNKKIPFDIFFKDGVFINIPKFKLTYSKPYKSSKHKLVISNPNKLLDAFTFIKTDKTTNGFIDIETEDFANTSIRINNINLDINSTYFNLDDNNKTEDFQLPLFPKIDLSYTNSNIKYDNLTLSFDKLNLITNNNILNLNIIKEESIIDLATKDNGIIFNANNLNDKYVNNFFNKKIFEGGYIDLNIYGEDINQLSGDVNFHKTTVKNVTIINNLLTFVNTTPAIINPLLALPTLFRVAETGFDINGYYMKRGNGSFRYYLPTRQLDIYDLYTNGKMSNFIVNSHLDLKTKKIDANVDISFLKDFTKAIRHIPILGYIIMGEDGEFHTSVNITGTTEHPILETNTVKEATNGITGIFKRIFLLPLLPFKD